VIPASPGKFKMARVNSAWIVDGDAFPAGYGRQSGMLYGRSCSQFANSVD